MHNINLISHILATTDTTTTDIANITENIQGVESFSKLISEYGPAVVIMAIFFLIFIFLVILIVKNNSKMMSQIISNQSSSRAIEDEILSKFVDNALTKLTEKQSTTINEEIQKALEPLKNSIDNNNLKNNGYHKNLVEEYIDLNMAFKDISRSTLNSLNCDRIGIYVFHNGNQSMHGLPFFKMSCIHEWTTKGSATVRGKSHIDMPLHLFNDFIEDLWKTGIYRSENIYKSAEIDASIKEFASYSDTKALYIMATRDENDIITGFIVAEFNNEDTFEHDETRNKEINDVLSQMVLKVSPLLNYSTYKSKKNNK